MQTIYDFLMSALPWVAIGMFVACSMVTANAKKEGKELRGLFKVLSWSPAAAFLFVAIMEMSSGNTSSGTTWLVLGVFNAVVNFANTGYAEKQ